MLNEDIIILQCLNLIHEYFCHDVSPLITKNPLSERDIDCTNAF